MLYSGPRSTRDCGGGGVQRPQGVAEEFIMLEKKKYAKGMVFVLFEKNLVGELHGS